MVLLQPRLNVKLSQRQILTPGLVQMVSVLALNKLELKDMINAEMVENPVLEELEDAIPLLDDVGRQEEERDRIAAKATSEEAPAAADEKKDPFEEIDFGSFFQEYLDPGYRSSGEMEEIEKPSFENFLSKPGNLSDHLLWQLGAISVRPPVHQAAELGIAGGEAPRESSDLESSNLEASALAPEDLAAEDADASQLTTERAGIEPFVESNEPDSEPDSGPDSEQKIAAEVQLPSTANHRNTAAGAAAMGTATAPARIAAVNFTVADLHEALEVVRQFDPPGIACRDLRECLLYQLRYHLGQLQLHRNGSALTEQVVRDAIAVVDQHLRAVTLKQFKEIARAIGRPVEAVQVGLEYVRTLDPRPGLRYNKVPARLIEPDVAFVKHGDEWLVIMNDEDMPQLCLNPAYKR